jgi:superfamily I DNA and/or RNA helicase
LPLADSVAVSASARRSVALGDPQQLAAPIRAAHDESVRVSLFEHIAQDRAVLPTDGGVFLTPSYRMHPAVCDVVGRLAYDGELMSAPDAARRDIEGENFKIGSRDLVVRPGVSWLPVEGGSDAEVSAVVDLVDSLVS